MNRPTMGRPKPITPPPPAPGARLLKAGASALQPDVWVVGEGETERVLKTFGRAPSLVRSTLCRWIAEREARNLRILEGIEGTPRYLSQPHPWSIEMTKLNAVPVPERRDAGALSLAYFDRLEVILGEMHARGVNHGDLRRKNLLVNPETGLPCVLDFAQSMKRGRAGGLFDRIVFRRAVEVDRLKFLELKRWYLGDVLSAAEQEELGHEPLHLRFGKTLRKRVYRPFKHWRAGMSPRRRRKRAEKKARHHAEHVRSASSEESNKRDA